MYTQIISKQILSIILVYNTCIIMSCTIRRHTYHNYETKVWIMCMTCELAVRLENHGTVKPVLW